MAGTTHSFRFSHSRKFSAVRRFRRSERGSVTMIFGLMAIVLFAVVGLAVDLGRWVNARDHTIAAIDAAVLAAGRAIQTGSDSNLATDVARAFYNNAIESRIDTVDDGVQFEVIENGMAVTATGNATLRTPFMAILGVRQLPLLRQGGAVQDANGGSDVSVARIAVGGNSGTHVETVLMLDVSGSMQGSKIEDMKEAAKDLVNIVVWQDQSSYQSRVALVPFSADVRPPAGWLATIAKSGETFSRSTTYSTTYFAPTDCVAERGGASAYAHNAPEASTLLTRVHRQVGGSWYNSASCYIHSDAEVLPLTNDKSALTNRIDALVAQGGTAGHVGTAWAYYMLSPDWQSIVPAQASARGWSHGTNRKVAVLMTDGEYNFTYDNDQGPSSARGGTGSNGLGSINGKSSAEQAKLTCNEMKSQGIEVFTVGFELGTNQTAIGTMQHCASSQDHYYPADDGEELRNAFRDIALQISKLYLSN